MTHTYMSLIAGGVSTRHAAVLTGMVRSTATRRHTSATAPTAVVLASPAPDPVNKLTVLERRRVLEVLTSDRFVDLAPLQIYAQLLDEGLYLCSVSTMYRVLAENTLIAERRRQARHPAKVCPELVATGPRQVYSWDITKLARRGVCAARADVDQSRRLARRSASVATFTGLGPAVRAGTGVDHLGHAVVELPR